jgi:hypothetical protein
LQQITDPAGGGQFINMHPVGQTPVVVAVLAGVVVVVTGAVCFAVDFKGAGATVSVPAQAGATINANNNSRTFFIITLLLWLKKHSRLVLARPTPSPN